MIKQIMNKIEKVQYTASLAMTGALLGISKENNYDELDLNSLTKR